MSHRINSTCDPSVGKPLVLTAEEFAKLTSQGILKLQSGTSPTVAPLGMVSKPLTSTTFSPAVSQPSAVQSLPTPTTSSSTLDVNVPRFTLAWLIH